MKMNQNAFNDERKCHSLTEISLKILSFVFKYSIYKVTSIANFRFPEPLYFNKYRWNNIFWILSGLHLIKIVKLFCENLFLILWQIPPNFELFKKQNIKTLRDLV